MKNSPLPPHKLVTCIPEKREPGMMVFNVRPGGASEHIYKDAWILGIDQAGAFALNLHFAEQTQDVRLLPNKAHLPSLELSMDSLKMQIISI